MNTSGSRLVRKEFRPASERRCARHDDEFGVAAVAMFSDHLGGRAKLFGASLAESALPARHKIMNADAISGLRTLNVRTHFLDHDQSLHDQG